MPIGDGDVVGLRNDEVSFFDLEVMKARVAAVGSEIAPVPRQPAGNLSLIPWEAAVLRQGD